MLISTTYFYLVATLYGQKYGGGKHMFVIRYFPDVILRDKGIMCSVYSI